MEIDDLTCTETVVEDLSNDGSLPYENGSVEEQKTEWIEEDGSEMREESPVEEEVDEEVIENVAGNAADTKHQPGEYQFQLLPNHIHQKGDTRNGVYKTYKCDICEQIYRHVFSLKRHFLRCHINYKYLTSTDITNCGIHMQVIQAAQNDSALNGDDLYRCHICNQLFPERDQLRTHTESHAGKDKKSFPSVSCGKCSAAFVDRKSLQRHQVVHNGLPQNTKKLAQTTCKYCSKIFSEVPELRRHERLHEATDTTCKVCEKSFALSEFVMHKTTIHPDTNHWCTYCDKIFSDVQSLGHHLFSHHGKTYSDNVRQINKENGVAAEIREEVPELETRPERNVDTASVSCEICNKSFSSLVNLQRHNTVVHVKQFDKKSPQENKMKMNGHRNPSGEEFYRTLAHRISENLQYHIDGRLPGSNQASAFESERVEANNCMPWLVNNFPPTLDITHIVQIYASRPPLATSNPLPTRAVDSSPPTSGEQIALGASLGLNPVKKDPVPTELPTLFICQVCGLNSYSQAKIIEHKYFAHPNIVATHLELEGHSSVPPELATQFVPTNKGILASHDADCSPDEERFHCTKCSKSFGTLNDLHLHIIQCGSGHLSVLGAGFRNGQRPPSPRQIKQRKFGPVLNTKRSEDSVPSPYNSSEYSKDDPRRKRKIDDRPQRRSARSTYCGGPSECTVCGHSFPSQASLRKHMLDECREEQSYRRKKRKESPTGTPEPSKMSSMQTETWGDDFLDGKMPEQFNCRSCSASFTTAQQHRRHTAQCPPASRSKSLLATKSTISGGASSSAYRSQYEEMTMLGLVQRAERDRQRDVRGRSSEENDEDDDEDTKVYRCPTCHMGFGDYVKMLHHSMNEHGTPIPDAQTFHRESTGLRNGHSQVVVKAIHKDVPIEVREEVVHENGNGTESSAQCSQVASVYDSEDLRDKERIAIEALSAIFGMGSHQQSSNNNNNNNNGESDNNNHQNNNNNNNEGSGKYAPNRSAQPLMDHRY